MRLPAETSRGQHSRNLKPQEEARTRDRDSKILHITVAVKMVRGKRLLRVK